jgi:hypothetical protein
MAEIFAQQFGVNFAYAVDCGRPLDGHIRRQLPRSEFTKNAYCGGDEETKFVVFGNLQNILK